MKVVIDTNVLVSALINEHGLEALVLFAASDEEFTWCVSPAILAEYEAVLQRPKFSKVAPAYIRHLLDRAAQGQVVAPSITLNISPHEGDNRFYECASAARADYIVTGNARHFPEDLPSTRIVNARQLLEKLKQ
jgi:uncharacterized protein